MVNMATIQTFFPIPLIQDSLKSKHYVNLFGMIQRKAGLMINVYAASLNTGERRVKLS